MKNTIPTHVAIIMDGNRRWARQKGWQAYRGHQIMVREKIGELVNLAMERKIKYLTLWCLSTENWQRSKAELKILINLFREIFTANAANLHQKGTRINTIGDLSVFPEDIIKNVLLWKEKTKDNKNITLTLALNYGGKDEILRAVAGLINNLKNGKITLKPKKVIYSKNQRIVTEKILKQYFDTADLPDPDLIIRPGGEKRISNFMIWEGAHSELYFSDVLMPDFGEAELDKALADFAGRQRRFGK